MDDLTAQERELIMTFRHLGSFTVIVHRMRAGVSFSPIKKPAGQRPGKVRISGRLGIA